MDAARADPGDGPLLALIAGEASGDLLGGALLAALRARLPRARFVGIGGARMRAQGMDCWHDIGELSVMGMAEVLQHLPRLLRLRRRLIARLLAARPALTIGIDAPDFNLGLERQLKQARMHTAHYVSPSVWAWREGRAQRIRTSADRVLCLFPMEPAIYARHGVDARFVGHPLADRFADRPDRSGARAALGLPQDAPLLAVLPGSRRGELARLLPPFLAATRILLSERQRLLALIPAAHAGLRAPIEAALRQHDLPAARVRVLDGQADTVLMAADATVLASGTAALEAALARCPMAVGYRIAPLTHLLVKRLGLLRSTRYSLPNILAGRDLVPELMQHECTGPRLAATLAPLLDGAAAAQAQRAAFPALHAALRAADGRSAADAAALALIDLITLAP